MQPSGILPTQAVTQAEYRLQPTQNLELPQGEGRPTPLALLPMFTCVLVLVLPLKGRARQHPDTAGGSQSPPALHSEETEEMGKGQRTVLVGHLCPQHGALPGLAHPHQTRGVGTPVIPTVQSR